MTGDLIAGPAVPIPAHERREAAWQQSVRGGTVDDRRLRTVVVAVPPAINDLTLELGPALVARCEDAVRAVAHLDATRGEHLVPLASILLRAESVASSKIEHEEASIDDFARALHGVEANSSATAMAASVGAISRLLQGPLDEDSITTAHRELFAHNPGERASAGRWREVQNWIGGSDYSPRGALYVPPPPDLVAEAMVDLLAFARRDDVPVLAQSAVMHAQFESIHPFPDGNGRIGRALSAAVLRHRGVAQHVVIPVAAALVARREHYFATLEAYRNGDAGPIIAAFATSARIAAEEAELTAARIAELPGRWDEAAGRPRAGSAARRVLDSLASAPVFSTEDLEERLRLPTATAYRVVERLRRVGVIRPLTERVRNQVWGTHDLLVELEDLGVRIADRARARPGGL